MEEKIRVIDELEEKVGGRFQLTALLQKRIRELVAGAPRLVRNQYQPARDLHRPVEVVLKAQRQRVRVHFDNPLVWLFDIAAVHRYGAARIRQQCATFSRQQKQRR